MILKRWHVQKWFDPNNGPICDIEVDGVARSIHYWPFGRRLAKEDCGSIYHFFVAEGSEIGPWGHLFEYTDGSLVSPTSARPAPLHALARLRLVRRERYPNIFISYRREDADAYAGRLHEVLAQEFGAEEVFLAEFSIRGGEVWDWTIQQAIAHAQVVLALVGRQWLTLKTGDIRRIDDPQDLVRREMVGALNRGTPVVPVLLPEASIPRGFDWHHELHLLPQLQFHRIAGPRHWKADVDDLIVTIRQHLATAAR